LIAEFLAALRVGAAFSILRDYYFYDSEKKLIDSTNRGTR